jgi:methyl-accepting chemotaxis protein WspA
MTFAHRFRLTSVIASLLVLGMLGVTTKLWFDSEKWRAATERERVSQELSTELKQSSDELTRLARTYVVTGDARYEADYWQVLAIRNGQSPRPDGRTIALRTLMIEAGFTPEELGLLERAEANSNALVAIETAAFQAMVGRFMPTGTSASRNAADYLTSAEPDPEYAIRIMHDERYHAEKAQIMEPIAESATLVRDRTKNEVEALSAQMEQIIGLAVLLGALLLTLFWLNQQFAQRPVIRAIGRVSKDLEEISTGAIDLSRRINNPRNDELGALARALDRTLERVGNLVTRVAEASELVADAAAEITTAAQQQRETSGEFGASTSEIAASTNEISANSRELLETLTQVAATSSATAEVANRGRGDIDRMEASMQALSAATASISGKLAMISERANNIGTVVTTITRVADQTNLLSLNAAIEAEKAGEYGLGFSVVAREIRRLADQTEVATLDIERIVGEMQSSVSAGVMEMDRFDDQVRAGVQETMRIGNELSAIIGGVEGLGPRFDQAQQSMRSQAVGAGQINDAMIRLREAALGSGESSERLYVASAQLSRAIEELQSEVARFSSAPSR